MVLKRGENESLDQKAVQMTVPEAKFQAGSKAVQQNEAALDLKAKSHRPKRRSVM